MADDVKRRPYRSDLRREQAEQTRGRVLSAAAELFVERGYDATSIAAVAERAGVSAETIYARFRNKRTLIGAVMKHAVRGADPRPVPEQDAPRALAAETDQREQLRLFAADIALRLERAAPLAAVVAGAARADPEIAELFERLHRNRLENLSTLIDAVAANGPLRLSPEQALETTWALTSPELHQLLVRVRGWTRGRYRDWLADSLTMTLLGLSAVPGSASRSEARRRAGRS
jgi:AcrR family transcriptional regulator